MTAEEQVRTKWPEAFACACRLCPLWHIYNGSPRYADFKKLGEGDTALEAWANAASRITTRTPPREGQHG